MLFVPTELLTQIYNHLTKVLTGLLREYMIPFCWPNFLSNLKYFQDVSWHNWGFRIVIAIELWSLLLASHNSKYWYIPVGLFPCFFLLVFGFCFWLLFHFYSLLFLENLKMFHLQYTTHSSENFSTGEAFLNERTLRKTGMSYNPRQSRNLDPSIEGNCGTYFYLSSFSMPLCLSHSNPLLLFSFSISPSLPLYPVSIVCSLCIFSRFPPSSALCYQLLFIFW